MTESDAKDGQGAQGGSRRRGRGKKGVQPPPPGRADPAAADAFVGGQQQTGQGAQQPAAEATQPAAEATQPAAEEPRPATRSVKPREDMKRMTVDVPKDQHRKLRLYCLNNDVQMNDVVRRLIAQLVDEQ